MFEGFVLLRIGEIHRGGKRQTTAYIRNSGTGSRVRERYEPLSMGVGKRLQQHAIDQYGRGFMTLGEEQQAQLIATVSTATLDSGLQKFFGVVRAEALRGYYTTADGLKELDYKGNWYYASCPGCEQEK